MNKRKMFYPSGVLVSPGGAIPYVASFQGGVIRANFRVNGIDGELSMKVDKGGASIEYGFYGLPQVSETIKFSGKRSICCEGGVSMGAETVAHPPSYLTHGPSATALELALSDPFTPTVIDTHSSLIVANYVLSVVVPLMIRKYALLHGVIVSPQAGVGILPPGSVPRPEKVGSMDYYAASASTGGGDPEPDISKAAYLCAYWTQQYQMWRDAYYAGLLWWMIFLCPNDPTTQNCINQASFLELCQIEMADSKAQSAYWCKLASGGGDS